jgi:glycosyltransferase involved in cell wall biosynthesis
MDPGFPLVSVITATYNSSTTLALTIQSVLRQDLQDFEMLVIGDACTDDSESVVAAVNDPRVHWFNLSRNSGSQSAPNNEGLRRARGRYLAFIGHDDLWLPWHLSRLVERLDNSGVDLVHSLCPVITPDGVIDVMGAPPQGATYAVHFVPPSSWVHRRELIDSVGEWREPDSLRFGVDHDFLRRAYFTGARIECIPQLSVLKFPSAYWGLYARKANPPQVSYWQAVQGDPRKVAEQVLTDFAVTYGRRLSQNFYDKPRLALSELCLVCRQVLRAIAHRLLKTYQREDGLFDAYLVRRFQRARQRRRRQRGLSD